MNLTDSTLLKKIKSGDRPAFMLLYDRYWDNLYRFVFVRTKDKEVSEELLQNLWIKILENTDMIQTDESESAKGYLLRHLHYRILDYYNSFKKAPPTLSINKLKHGQLSRGKILDFKISMFKIYSFIIIGKNNGLHTGRFGRFQPGMAVFNRYAVFR